MNYSDGNDESAPVFYIGQHESKRDLDVSQELVHHAQDLGVSSRTTMQGPSLTMFSMTCSPAPLRTTTSRPAF
jgi:hypothetical protein